MKIPQEISQIIEKLQSANFEAFAVGGCVRDLLRNVKPKDWDIATSAKPNQIQKIFPKSFYENTFGTVTVQTGSQDDSLKDVEITTYRVETEYSDKRHPDRVSFTENLKEDLARRDFTINAMGLKPVDGKLEIVDPFNGQEDLNSKLIRAVGNPEERFSEDALRLLRAIRFAITLQLEIEKETFAAIKKLAGNLARVSRERVRDELIKIVMSPDAEKGIYLLQESGLLEYIIPELVEGVGVEQNKHHVFTVFDHNVKSLGYSAKSNDPLHIRLAVLLHDVAKPRTKRGKSPDATFYGHDIVGASMTQKILTRLKFPNKIVDQAAHLVRNHLFVYDIGKVTEAGVRRLLKRVGKENFQDLLKLRMAERLGSGVPKARPYRLRHLEFMADKVSHDPLSTKMLKINGHDLIEKLKLTPGPKIGAIMDVLLAEVLKDPKKNTKSFLLEKAQKLIDEDLSQLRNRAKDTVSEKEKEREEEIKKKYHV